MGATSCQCSDVVVRLGYIPNESLLLYGVLADDQQSKASEASKRKSKRATKSKQFKAKQNKERRQVRMAHTHMRIHVRVHMLLSVRLHTYSARLKVAAKTSNELLP